MCTKVLKIRTYSSVERELKKVKISTMDLTLKNLRDEILKFEIVERLGIVRLFYRLITLCMELSWFCHTNSGQLFCNCPLFVIAPVPGLFFGWKPDETCCHSVVASK